MVRNIGLATISGLLIGIIFLCLFETVHITTELFFPYRICQIIYDKTYKSIGYNAAYGIYIEYKTLVCPIKKRLLRFYYSDKSPEEYYWNNGWVKRP